MKFKTQIDINIMSIIHLFRVSVNKNDLNALLGFITSQPDVSIISEKRVKSTMVLKGNEKSIILLLLESQDQYTFLKYSQSLSTGNTVAWNHNLSGKDLVFGIGDTGVDNSHCLFYDDKEVFQFNKQSDSHRKIKKYITYEDNSDSQYI